MGTWNLSETKARWARFDNSDFWIGYFGALVRLKLLLKCANPISFNFMNSSERCSTLFNSFTTKWSLLWTTSNSEMRRLTTCSKKCTGNCDSQTTKVRQHFCNHNKHFWARVAMEPKCFGLVVIRAIVLFVSATSDVSVYTLSSRYHQRSQLVGSPE